MSDVNEIIAETWSTYADASRVELEVNDTSITLQREDGDSEEYPTFLRSLAQQIRYALDDIEKEEA